MKIATNLDSITTGLNIMTAIVTDSLLQDDLKNIIFWVRGTSVSLVAYNVTVTNCTSLDDAVVTYGEDEAELKEQSDYFVQIQAKSLMGVLNSFSGLRKTKVSSVEFEFTHDKQLRAESAVITIHEEPVDPSKDFADKYFQKSRFRLTVVRLQDKVKAEISKIETTEQKGDIVKREDILTYLNCLVPTISKETRSDSVMARITFKPDYVYTVPVQYVAMIENRLPECMNGFSISSTIAKFLINFVSIDEYFSFEKEVIDGLAIITVTNDHSTAVIKTHTTDKGFDITPYKLSPSTGIAVDKEYFCDVLKRLSINNETITVKIEVSSGVFKVSSKLMTQTIPVLNFKGDGECIFEIMPEYLSSMSLAHVSYFGEILYIYFIKDESKNQTSIIFRDNSSMWKTVMNGAKKNGSEDGWN